ncbi:MAG TPA: SurA N-terminal domain-containing protein, partial [Vicinamibacteria bacterium]|nr:SurA N-terminal domain-containing protein [Vicinamibacteria bacterium]
MALALMRRHKRWLYIFLWLVIAAFIILYIPAFQDEGRGTPGEAVMTVGGLPVSVGEFQRTYTRQRQLYDRLYQGRLDESMLRQLGLEEQVLEGLVGERLVELEAKRLGVSVSDEAVARAIATSPEYQDDGRFIGTDEIRRRLDLQGLSEEDFEHSLRRQLMRQSLEELVGSAVSVSDAEVEREFRRRTEQVKLEYVLADAARFKAGIQPTEGEIAARFESKKGAYRVPEKRVVSYVLLDRPTLQPQVAVTDRDLELYYQDHREEFRQEEEACASHILVKVKAGETGEGHPDPEARQIAEGLLAQVKGGADFAELAKKSSEDQGSAQGGGDLGCFPPGRMVPEFDDAVFALQPGQMSELVKSSFGYHVIRLASKRESSVLPLAQVKERIRASVTEVKVRDLGEQK